MIKDLLKSILPSIAYSVLRNLNAGNRLSWAGNYSSWDEAVSRSGGYDAREVVLRVQEATVEVIEGRAAYERDGTTFSNESPNLPFLAALLMAAQSSSRPVHVVDFGGSLGSTYFQNRRWLEHLGLRWTIVEQESFVEVGRKLPLAPLEFAKSSFEISSTGENIFLLYSSVLQYLDQPERVLKINLEQLSPAWVFLDRTPFHNGDGHRLTVQNVPASIYRASYPCWFFNRKTLYSVLEYNYQFDFSFEAKDQCLDFPSSFEGSFWRRREPVGGLS